MKLIIIFRSFLLTNLISLSLASLPADQPGKLNPPSPLYSRISGFGSSEKHKSFMTCLVNVFYSLPMVQNAFFEESGRMAILNRVNPLTISISFKLVAIRILSGNLNHGLGIFKALKDITNKDYESKNPLHLSFFLILLISSQPPKIKSLFAINRIFAVDQINRERMLIDIPLDRGEMSLTDVISEYFTDNSTGSEIQILNPPEVLIISIDRMNVIEDEGKKKVFFCRTLVILYQEIVFGGDAYIFAGHVDFDIQASEYSTCIRDFGNDLYYKYSHEGTVAQHSVEFDESVLKDTRSVLAFYVKKESIAKLKSSAEYLQIISRNEDIPRILLETFNSRGFPPKSKSSFENTPKAKIAKVGRSQANPQGHVVTLITHQSLQASSDPKSDPNDQELLDLISKLDNPDFEFGGEEYSFEGFNLIMPYAAFELVLSALAVSSSALKIYFDLIESGIYSKFDFLVAKALTQLFLGMKSIPIHEMVDELCQIKSIPKKSFYELQQNAYILTNLNLVMDQMQSGIFDGVRVSIVEYKGMLSDDPISVRDNGKYCSLISKLSIPFLPAVIDGVYADSYNQVKNGRNRHIFKTTSLFLPIHIIRTFELRGGIQTLVSETFFSNPSTNELVGIFCFDNGNVRSFKSLFLDHANRRLRKFKPGFVSISAPSCPPHSDQLIQNFQKTSFYIFYSQIRPENTQNLSSKHIPEVIRTAIRDDLMHKLK